MKNWYGYQADGKVVSIEMHGYGWADDADWNNPLCPAGGEDCGNDECKFCQGTGVDKRVATPARARRLADGIIGWAAFDCPCPGEQRVCECHNSKIAFWHVNPETKEWVEKPQSRIWINGAEQPDVLRLEDRQLRSIDVPYSSTIKFKIVGPDIPDGGKIEVGTSGLDQLYEEVSWEMEVTGGTTAEIDLTAPQIGAVSMLTIHGKWARPQALVIRGVLP